eukprot:TRINITY_DN7442_c0_g1_i4.p1 TRINITY_DN7442_c0_g1~~TRINITY_DN7442_c0_g1_i4.p1  ORF type:complete len:1133 (-),score=212.53 TRINITY_DN7442_c0_g1_i4:276-3674(-)
MTLKNPPFNTNSSDFMETQDPTKRPRQERLFFSSKKPRNLISRTGFLYLRSLDSPFIHSGTNSLCKLICLRSDRLYTLGRKNRLCEFLFDDSRVSNRHCQIFFDGFERRVFIVDGFFLSSDIDQIRRRFRCGSQGMETSASLNGVFVNGIRIQSGSVVVLSVGDEVSFACRSRLVHKSGNWVGFVLEKIVYAEDIEGKLEKACVSGRSCDALKMFESMPERVVKDTILCRLGNEELSARVLYLLSKCRGALQSVDPILYIRKFVNFDKGKVVAVTDNHSSPFNRNNVLLDLKVCRQAEVSSTSRIKNGENICNREQLCLSNLGSKKDLVNGMSGAVKTDSVEPRHDKVWAAENYSIQATELLMPKEVQSSCVCGSSGQMECPGNCKEKAVGSFCNSHSNKDSGIGLPSVGKRFFLNRLYFEDPGLLDQHTAVSLPELLYPVGTLLRIFIATFTSDVLWFLSYCKVPNLLPITVACHNSERCWSASHDKRTSMPYPDYPNLLVVYPPFPDVIAFGKDRKKKGIACHHPKLIVLQREDSIRIVVTSANLVSKQWNSVTNTVWWQDFPRRSTPDYSSLFARLSYGETNENPKSDFVAQLAGFIASLVVDVPTQAHWIMELAKYDFGGAVGHLVASIPGFHVQSVPCPSEAVHFLSAKHIASSWSTCMEFLGSIQASVVGLNHRFRTGADSNGAQLKTLASFLRRCRENVYGMSEVILKRNINIPADRNAVSVLVCDLDECSEGDYVQLGFLPKDVAKWVAPLCDTGFFRFSACIYPKEALAAALEGTNSRVQLILYVSQGPNFSEISRLAQPEHIAALSSLLASMQRSLGLWRLQELLCRYKWPEPQETDFIYSSSSIGTSVGAQFVAAFSAAAGKRSYQLSESEESDPEWGCWNANLETRSPSLRIIFPTIDRVKNGTCGIWPSRYMLSFSERTWQRLRKADILHDAIPHPCHRLGYPMHVKVARRRFWSEKYSASFGWVYCGSHNFSPAAWGNLISQSSNINASGAVEASVLRSRLHICNYELGIIFIIPPSDISKRNKEKSSDLDDIVLPFFVPAPKYRCDDMPATTQAMRAALEKEKSVAIKTAEDLIDEETSDEEEMVEATDFVPEEQEEEKIYAEMLWSQVDSSGSEKY